MHYFIIFSLLFWLPLLSYSVSLFLIASFSLSLCFSFSSALHPCATQAHTYKVNGEQTADSVNKNIWIDIDIWLKIIPW